MPWAAAIMASAEPSTWRRSWSGLLRAEDTAFSRSLLPDWAADPIVAQHRHAHAPPDLRESARAVVAEAGMGDPAVALEHFLYFIDVQTDAFAEHTQLLAADLKAIRETLLQRPDFDPRMLFDYLTYFGPEGVALNNGLVGQVDVFRSVLVEEAREGHLG